MASRTRAATYVRRRKRRMARVARNRDDGPYFLRQVEIARAVAECAASL